MSLIFVMMIMITITMIIIIMLLMQMGDVKEEAAGNCHLTPHFLSNVTKIKVKIYIYL